MSANERLIAITDLSALQKAGLPWKTLDQARWAFRKRNDYGLAECFLRMGKSIFVDPERFHDCVRGRDGREGFCINPKPPGGQGYRTALIHIRDELANLLEKVDNALKAGKSR